jgi:hypothetical protein
MSIRFLCQSTLARNNQQADSGTLCHREAVPGHRYLVSASLNESSSAGIFKYDKNRTNTNANSPTKNNTPTMKVPDRLKVAKRKAMHAKNRQMTYKTITVF